MIMNLLILKILILVVTLLTPPPCSSSCLCGEDRASPPMQLQGDTGFQGDTFKQRQPQLQGVSLQQWPGWKVGGQRRVRFLTRTAVTPWLKLAHREETGSAVEEQKFPLTAAWCSGAGATASSGDKVMSTTPGPGLASLWLSLAVRHLPLSPASQSHSWQPAESLLGWESLRLLWSTSTASPGWFGGRRNSGVSTDFVCIACSTFNLVC